MRARLGILVEGTRLSAAAVRRGRVVWAASADYADSDDLARAIASLAAERPRGARSVTVAVGADVARMKAVTGLPHLKPADLAAHVQLNSRRYFLQNGIPLVTDARAPRARRGSAAPDTAMLAAAPVPVVKAILVGIEAAGMRCRGIAPAEAMPGETGKGDALTVATTIATAPLPGLSLLPAGARARNDESLRRSLARWSMAAAASLLLAFSAWAFSLLRAERAARAELARIEPALAGALAVRRDLDAAEEALSVAGRAQDANAQRARFFTVLTRAMPDSAFLASARLEADGSGLLSGYAPRAATVLARLERELRLRGAALEGTVTREVVAGRELERFAIRFSGRHASRGNDR